MYLRNVFGLKDRNLLLKDLENSIFVGDYCLLLYFFFKVYFHFK